jgi:hypothetical protein
VKLTELVQRWLSFCRVNVSGRGLIAFCVDGAPQHLRTTLLGFAVVWGRSTGKRVPERHRDVQESDEGQERRITSSPYCSALLVDERLQGFAFDNP